MRLPIMFLREVVKDMSTEQETRTKRVKWVFTTMLGNVIEAKRLGDSIEFEFPDVERTSLHEREKEND